MQEKGRQKSAGGKRQDNGQKGEASSGIPIPPCFS